MEKVVTIFIGIISIAVIIENKKSSKTKLWKIIKTMVTLEINHRQTSVKIPKDKMEILRRNKTERKLNHIIYLYKLQKLMQLKW